MDRRVALLAVALCAASWARADEVAARGEAAFVGDALGEARPAPRVAAVELRLPPGDDEAAAAALVAVAPGERLSNRALRRTVRRLFQGGRYRNVVVRAEPAEPPAGAADERAGWVRVVVEALPVRLLGTVQVRAEGAPDDLAEAVRVAAGLQPGKPFDDPDLDAALSRVRAALARRGYRAARVEGRAGGDRVVDAEIVVAPGEPLRVVAVRLAGDAGPDGGALLASLATRSGAALDRDLLDKDARTLRAALYAAGHRRARVGAPLVRVAAGAAEVDVPVEAGPRMAILFRGNREVSSSVLARELGLEEGAPVDVPAVGAAADRLATFYRARGHAAVRVEAEEVRHGRELAIVFHVEEGRRYRLVRVAVEGLAFRDERWVRARLAALLDEEGPEPTTAEADGARALALSIPDARARSAPPPALAPHETLDDAAWDRAAQRLADEWRAQGFLEAVYLGASVSLDARARTAEVRLRFREGPRTHIESISFEGNSVVSLAELAREARVLPGAPLAYDKVEETRAAILRVYLSRGHIYARVEAREAHDRDRHLATIRFVVEEGPQVRIGRIVVTGNRRTRESVVRRALSVAEGDVYDADEVARSQAALLRLGVFRSVGLRVQDPEAPQETKDLAVEVAERPWATLSQGLGFSIANGPRAFVEYAQPNLLGRALELSARGKVNYPLDQFRPDLVGRGTADRIEGRADLGLRAPGLPDLPLPAGARADLIGEILHRKAYDLRRVTAVTGLDVGLTSRASFSLQYELEVDRIDKTAPVGFLTQADVERLRFDEGVTTLHAVRPSLSIDYRDNSAHPHRGWFAAAALEWARSLGGGDERPLFGVLPGSDIHTNMVKVSGVASGYVPVGRATVIALSLRGGRVFPLDGRSRTVIPRRFFLGGATTMRGYGEDELIQQDVRDRVASEARLCAASVTGVGCTERGRRVAGGQRAVSEGGEAFVLGKAELRLRLRGSLEAGLFADVGNLWLDPLAYRLVDLRANVGLGLRFLTPIGPAAVDVGFNVTPDQRLNERLAAPHFTIGLF
jgi:outer membrane protein assembly complex protein YaeT